MSKNLLAKYYQENKKDDYKKRLKEDIKIFLKKKKKSNTSRERYKKLSKDKKQKLVEYRISLLSIEKKYYRMSKNALL